MTIGICDYGIGGIGLYLQLRAISDVDILYFSDSGYVPYGKVQETELRERVAKVVDFLFASGADYVAVACNAASTVLEPNERVTGIIDHGFATVISEKVEKIGIAGGNRTIESGIYKTLFESRGMEVKQHAAQVLSLRIEAGEVQSEALTNDIRAVFQPLSDCDAVLLACTHYPIITSEILRVFPELRLLDPLESMVDFIRQNWQPMTGSAKERWMTSGNPRLMQQAAEKAFGITVTPIEQLIL